MDAVFITFGEAYFYDLVVKSSSIYLIKDELKLNAIAIPIINFFKKNSYSTSYKNKIISEYSIVIQKQTNFYLSQFRAIKYTTLWNFNTNYIPNFAV